MIIYGLPLLIGQQVSLKEIVVDPDISGHTALAYKNSDSTHRMILHKDGFVELYDHKTAGKETKNVAKKYPELVEELKNALNTRLC